MEQLCRGADVIMRPMDVIMRPAVVIIIRLVAILDAHVRYCTPYGNCTMHSGRYIKRWTCRENAYFYQYKGSNRIESTIF